MDTEITGLQFRHNLTLIDEMAQQSWQETRTIINEVYQTPVADNKHMETLKDFDVAFQRVRDAIRAELSNYNKCNAKLTEVQLEVTNIRKLTEHLKAVSDTTHATHEVCDTVVDSITKMLETCSHNDTVTAVKGELELAKNRLSVLVKGAVPYRSMLEIPICGVCLVNKTTELLVCGHMLCMCCVHELRFQHYGSVADDLIMCPICRREQNVSNTRTIYFNCE